MSEKTNHLDISTSGFREIDSLNPDFFNQTLQTFFINNQTKRQSDKELIEFIFIQVFKINLSDCSVPSEFSVDGESCTNQ